MRGVILNVPFWEDVSLKAIDLSNAWIIGGWLPFIRMVGQFYGTNIVETDLSSSVIEGRLNDVTVTRSNVSKTLFVSYTNGLDAFGIPTFVDAWAWADSPPLVAFKSDGTASATVTNAAIERLPQLYSQIVLCDPKDRASTEGTSDAYLELLKYTHRAKMNNLPEPVERWSISGVRPRMKEVSNSPSTAAKACTPVAWEVAVDLYPDKYQFQFQPQVLIEKGMQIAPKPQASTPSAQ
jgi:hypothetical protein